MGEQLTKNRFRMRLENGKIIGERGGTGISIKEFIEKYPNEILEYVLRVHELHGDLGGAIASAFGGVDKIPDFAKQHGFPKTIVVNAGYIEEAS